MSDPNLEKIKILKEMQHTEADLHWKRNGFFLLSSSILLVALGQLKDIQFISFSFGMLGLVLNVIWFLIQYRSSEYIKEWKRQVKELTKIVGSPDLYSSNVGGIEMRKLALVLPLPFLLIWGVIFIQSFSIH